MMMTRIALAILMALLLVLLAPVAVFDGNASSGRLHRLEASAGDATPTPAANPAWGGADVSRLSELIAMNHAPGATAWAPASSQAARSGDQPQIGPLLQAAPEGAARSAPRRRPPHDELAQRSADQAALPPTTAADLLSRMRDREGGWRTAPQRLGALRFTRGASARANRWVAPAADA